MDSWQYKVIGEHEGSYGYNNFSHGENYKIPDDEIEPLIRKMNNHTELYFKKPDAYKPPFKAKLSEVFHETSDGIAYCKPEPNEFYPCEDLMGTQWLRTCAWVVFLLALLGNLTVLFTLAVNCGKLDVPRILIANLALADLGLGVYLGFLAVVDIKTLGDFRAHALEWQFSSSCKTAGFLAVFSSELSVFTLTAITIERFFTIKNSMYTHKRMKKREAIITMIGGWIFSAIIASLPLYNGDTKFSDYTKYSVCLPFEAEGPASKAYLIFILLFNLIAFTVIMCCYIRLYLSVRNSSAWNSGDSRTARRMAILVITDFVCWFPIALVALSAVFENSLITDLWVSKVFTIFVFPLNACANPFLYTIFSRQFRKDIMAIAKQVKETSSRNRGLTKSLLRLPLKGSLTYSTSVRRGSSFSFLFGRRSSNRSEEIRNANMRQPSTNPKSPLTAEDQLQAEHQIVYREIQEMLTSV